jgi:hypothetical protein
MPRSLTNSTVKKLRHSLVLRRVCDWLVDRGIPIAKHERRNEAESTDDELHLGGEYSMKAGKVFIQVGDGYFCAVGRKGNSFLFVDGDDKMPLEEQLIRAYRFAKDGVIENY